MQKLVRKPPLKPVAGTDPARRDATRLITRNTFGLEQGPHVLIVKSKSNPVNGTANSAALTYKIEEGAREPLIAFPGQDTPS